MGGSARCRSITACPSDVSALVPMRVRRQIPYPGRPQAPLLAIQHFFDASRHPMQVRKLFLGPQPVGDGWPVVGAGEMGGLGRRHLLRDVQYAAERGVHRTAGRRQAALSARTMCIHDEPCSPTALPDTGEEPLTWAGTRCWPCASPRLTRSQGRSGSRRNCL